jgi:hypothetical protein
MEKDTLAEGEDFILPSLPMTRTLSQLNPNNFSHLFLLATVIYQTF